MKKMLLLVSLVMMTVANVKANVSEIAWPETVYEWYVGMDRVAADQIVYYENGFYQCTNAGGEDATEALPPTTSSYTKIADSRIWVVGMDHIQFEEYVIYLDKVYQCTNPEGTYAYSEGWNPTEWEAPNYREICTIILVNPIEEKPVEESELPDNYVGYWTDALVWEPGFHAIYNGKVYPCAATTHKEGGEHPETTWGYWGESLGDESSLLSLETVTIPAWDDERSWPIGAIVSYNGNYYKCLATTHKEGGEHPETTWGYWEALDLTPTSIGEMDSNRTAHYAIQNGHLYFLNDSSELHVQLYSVTGQLVNESNRNGVKLPYSGIFIVKAVVDGQSVSFKVIH